MDRTALFKATVKTIRTKNKALGVKEAARDILASKRHKSEFGTRAKDVVRNKLRYIFSSDRTTSLLIFYFTGPYSLLIIIVQSFNNNFSAAKSSSWCC